MLSDGASTTSLKRREVFVLRYEYVNAASRVQKDYMHHTAISIITVIMVSNSDHTLQYGEHSAALQSKHLQLHNQPFRRTNCRVKK